MTSFDTGTRVRLPGSSEWVTVRGAVPFEGGWHLFVARDDGTLTEHKVSDSAAVEQLSEDGGAESAAVLAGLWTQWMRAATQNASAAALASMPLVPYAHQSRRSMGHPRRVRVCPRGKEGDRRAARPHRCPLRDGDMQVSKWPRLVNECLRPHGIQPGGDIQLVVFTEFADTADWLVRRFRDCGFSAERYSGHDTHPVRDDIRARFEAREFQVIVSTDAGNEGIDLQSAHVLVNWDIPWSLVRLEQRMGRIHRVGQTENVELYNLIALGTREGDAHAQLLGNLITAANELGGKMFDSLSRVGEIVFEQERLGHPWAGEARETSRPAAPLERACDPPSVLIPMSSVWLVAA